MHEYYFTFRSITTAQRARELLRRQKLPGVLLRTPKAMAVQGCGHSLRVPAGAAEQAARLRRQEEIRFQRRYLPGDPPTEVYL